MTIGEADGFPINLQAKPFFGPVLMEVSFRIFRFRSGLAIPQRGKMLFARARKRKVTFNRSNYNGRMIQ
jgi:hypothetical protein